MSTTSSKSHAKIPAGPREYAAGCHCGFIRYNFTIDLSVACPSKCNCTICVKTGWLSCQPKPADFHLISPARRDDPNLGSYSFIPGSTVRRYFCKTCGVGAFIEGNMPELGGEWVSVNLNCVDWEASGVELADLKVGYWDGRRDNWQEGKKERPYPGGAW